MTPLAFGLGWPELIIILVVVLLLFGGTRLAGLGKSSGKALREFKEETKGLSERDRSTQQPTVDAEIVDPEPSNVQLGHGVPGQGVQGPGVPGRGVQGQADSAQQAAEKHDA